MGDHAQPGFRLIWYACREYQPGGLPTLKESGPDTARPKSSQFMFQTVLLPTQALGPHVCVHHRHFRHVLAFLYLLIFCCFAVAFRVPARRSLSSSSIRLWGFSTRLVGRSTPRSEMWLRWLSHIIDDFVRVAQLNGELSHEKGVVKKMEVGVEDCILTRQPVFAALLIHKRLRSGPTSRRYPYTRVEEKQISPSSKARGTVSRPWAAQVQFFPRPETDPARASRTFKEDSRRRRFSGKFQNESHPRTEGHNDPPAVWRGGGLPGGVVPSPERRGNGRNLVQEGEQAPSAASVRQVEFPLITPTGDGRTAHATSAASSAT